MQAINYEIFTFSLLLLPGCTSLFSTATSVGSTSSGFQRQLHAQRVSPVTRPRSVEGTNSQVPQLNPLHPKSTREECAGKSPVPVWVSLSSSEPPIRGLPNPLFFIAKFILYTHFPSLLLCLAYWNSELLSSVLHTYKDSAWSKPGHNMLLWCA